MALNRDSSSSVKVKRTVGKIALEEAVGVPFFNANATLPPQPLIAGIEELPFDPSFVNDVASRLDNVEARLESMDRAGIDYSIVSLTSPGIEGVTNPTEAVDLAIKSNNYIHEKYVVAHPDRFGFFCAIPLQSPPNAVLELERAVKKLGAKGVLVNGFTNMSETDINEVRYLDAPENGPFWATLAALDVPIYIHPRNPPPNQQRLYRGYPNLAQAAFAFSVETAGHALRIMCSGLLDRYPRVKIILGHCAEGLPFLIHRIDHRLAIGVRGANGPFKRSMMEYLQQNFFATCAGVRRFSTLSNAISEMGEDRIMFSVDYPFESNEEAANWFDGLEINENTRLAIASGNAKRILKLSNRGR